RGVAAEPGIQAYRRVFEIPREIDDREVTRRPAPRAEKMLQRLLDGEPPVLLVGARDRGLRLLVHDLREHPVAPQRILPGEDALRVVGKPRSVVTNEIAHQP